MAAGSAAHGGLVIAILRTLLSGGLALALTGTGMAAESAKEKVAPSGSLRVAIAVSTVASPFWTAPDANGKLRGVTIDLATAMAKEIGTPLELVTFNNSGAITEAASKGVWDVTFVPMDGERAKALDFGPVYNIAEATFLVPANSTAQTLEDLDKPGIKLAAVNNTTTMRAAQRSLKQPMITGYETVPEILALLKSGGTDGFALSRDNLIPFMKEIPGSRILPGKFQETKAAIAVPKGHSEALAYVSTFMQKAIDDGLLRRTLDANGLQNIDVPAKTAAQ